MLALAVTVVFSAMHALGDQHIRADEISRLREEIKRRPEPLYEAYVQTLEQSAEICEEIELFALRHAAADSDTDVPRNAKGKNVWLVLADDADTARWSFLYLRFLRRQGEEAPLNHTLSRESDMQKSRLDTFLYAAIDFIGYKFVRGGQLEPLAFQDLKARHPDLQEHFRTLETLATRRQALVEQIKMAPGGDGCLVFLPADQSAEGSLLWDAM